MPAPPVFTPKRQPNWLKPLEGIQLSSADVLRKHASEFVISALWMNPRYYRTPFRWTGYSAPSLSAVPPQQDAKHSSMENGIIKESLNSTGHLGLDVEAAANITADEALVPGVRNFMPASTYRWEVEAAEQMLQK